MNDLTTWHNSVPDEEDKPKPRWQGETRDLATAIRGLAKVHRLADDEAIEDAENWHEFVDELVIIITQLQTH